jgi:hypothetical protein
MMNNLKNKLSIHRYRNGREEINYFSRQMRPKYSLVEIDGKFYDRASLQKFVKDQASNIVPNSLKAMSTSEKNKVVNSNPWGIFGKVAILSKNLS